MRKNVLCIGELLIDFVCLDRNESLKSGMTFEKKAGGAPANVAAAVSKLGGDAQFSGCVGQDPFGDYLQMTLEREGVDCSLLTRDFDHSTTLAFVSLTDNGERDFNFVRGADKYLHRTDALNKALKKSSIVHFGSATAFMGDPLEKTYISLIEKAQAYDVLKVFDPNYRKALFGHMQDVFIKNACACLAKVDLVKVSNEELALLTGIDDTKIGLNELIKLGAKRVLVTLGSHGVMYANRKGCLKIEALPIDAVDTTGAGDAFIGGLLYKLSQVDNMKEALDDVETMKGLLKFASAVGACVCLSHGAIESLPTLDEVKDILKSSV